MFVVVRTSAPYQNARQHKILPTESLHPFPHPSPSHPSFPTQLPLRTHHATAQPRIVPRTEEPAPLPTPELRRPDRVREAVPPDGGYRVVVVVVVVAGGRRVVVVVCGGEEVVVWGKAVVVVRVVGNGVVRVVVVVVVVVVVGGE